MVLNLFSETLRNSPPPLARVSLGRKQSVLIFPSSELLLTFLLQSCYVQKASSCCDSPSFVLRAFSFLSFIIIYYFSFLSFGLVLLRLYELSSLTRYTGLPLHRLPLGAQWIASFGVILRTHTTTPFYNVLRLLLPKLCNTSNAQIRHQ